MRIAFFTDTSLPYINGVSSVVDTISTALAEDGHKITIFAPRPSKKKKIVTPEKNITIHYIASLPALIYPDLRVGAPLSPQLLKIAKNTNPDIIHIQSPYFVGAYGLVLGKLLKKPILGTLHGYIMEPEYLKSLGIQEGAGLLRGAIWKYIAFFYNQCHYVHTPASFTKKDLQAHGVIKPIFVIPNTINPDAIRKVNASTVQKLKQKLALLEHTVLYVGRLSPEKNIDILIKSFAIVAKKRKDVSLLIVGDGPERAASEKLCSERHIIERVVFTGEISYQDVLTKGYFQIADAFVTPSTSELQPMSLIEAMYFQLPIIGVAKRGTLEMLEGVGLLAKPNNALSLSKTLLTLLSDNALQKRLRLKSSDAFRRKYPLQTVRYQYESMYQTIINDFHDIGKTAIKSVKLSA